MARNGSGTYSTVNTFVAGNTITASGHNQNWADLASEMTNSVAADGQTSMTGPLKSANGTEAAPSISFASDPDSGFYRKAANSIAVSLEGTDRVIFATATASFTGDVTVAGAASFTSVRGAWVSSATATFTTGLISSATATFTTGLTTGAGIAFPASQVASSNANTLDDYEEGVWTPAITFATAGDLSVVHDIQSGAYTKIGRLVTIHFTITTSTFTHSTASGELRIGGLPFQGAQLGGFGQRGGPVAFQGITKADYTQFVINPEDGTDYMRISASGSGQSLATVSAADMPTGGTVLFRGFATYYV
jgi:hypothetical protein